MDNEQDIKIRYTYQLIIFWIMTILIFLAVCLICYKLLFDFFDMVNIPDYKLFKKEILTLLFIVFCGLNITKYIVIFNDGGELFGQYLSGVLFFFLALGFYMTNLYLITLSCLLLTGFFVYDGFEKTSVKESIINLLLIIFSVA